jgi:hypothetical protein
METIDFNQTFQREEKESHIISILKNFELNKNNMLFKKGIYVYGDPGSGKTRFVIDILNKLNYDIIKYDAGDIRNKSVIENITKHNMSDKNIMSLFNNQVKKIAIIMDEIDGMNNGDKGGINTLIKLIRPKKTKKQKLEEVTMNPIICIGNYHIDKKIKELMKVCNVIELQTPTVPQISLIIDKLIPTVEDKIRTKLVNYVQGDIRKLTRFYEIYKKSPDIFYDNIIDNVCQLKSYNDDTKKITSKLINHNYGMDKHHIVMNETDRTIVGLLWHENIIDVFGKMNKADSVPFYLKQLDNMCFADYIDRITFQKQIWQFNEMSSLIKTFKNNKLYHEYFTNSKSKHKSNPADIRFTKVLTKYSTEFNNYIFIQSLCQLLGMDKKDIFSFFSEIRNKYDDASMALLFENYEINKLDINRIYRYLDKYTKADCADEAEIIIEEDLMELVCVESLAEE